MTPGPGDERGQRREIGGYIELDRYRLPMLHEGAAALNSGRCALLYLIRARGIRRLLLPRLICDSVTGICEREGIPYSFYSVGTDFLPAQEVELKEGEWFYFVNYYSQHGNERIAEYVRKYGRVIVDQAQSYFQAPIPGVDTLYTCRKYFGVADGAFLYTDCRLGEELPQDESFERMRFLLGRFERTAQEFYGEYVDNNRLFAAEPLKRMSRLTDNLLRGIDYEFAERARRENFRVLHERLGGINELQPSEGTFMYPLMIGNGPEVRRKLQAMKIYIPVLWPSVFGFCSPQETEYRMAQDILPLPVDQRYTAEDMAYISEELIKCL